MSTHLKTLNEYTLNLKITKWLYSSRSGLVSALLGVCAAGVVVLGVLRPTPWVLSGGSGVNGAREGEVSNAPSQAINR